MTKCKFPIQRLAALCILVASPLAAASDPTVAADAMADALRRRLADTGDMRLHALVVGAAGDGVALVGADAARATAVRRGAKMVKSVDGLKVDVSVKAVTPRGVELESSGGSNGVMLPGSFTPLAAPTNPPPEFLAYLESENVPIGGLMRLVSDQTGVNISVSDAASKKAVSIFLRNVTAESAVEEICRATGLWFRREPNGRVVRVMTMEEYSDNLNTFREESTEMFTLLYPNVVEVASVIYGLYPDRTLVSLGEEEFDEDDEYDLSRRFRRFRVLDDNGGSQFMSLEAPQTSSTGSRSGSGNFSFSRGSATSRLTQWDQLRWRSRQRNRTGGEQIQLGADDARLMERAYRGGNTNLLDSVRAQTTASAANIFVSLSRKNNILVVRTSDVRVMDEIRSLVKKLDVPTPMVLMEVKVLEVNVDDNFEATFRYSFNRGTHSVGHGGDPNPANIFADVLQASQPQYDPAFAFKVIGDNITAQIQLLQQDGKVKTLATPTLLVANNEVSRIFSGKEYPLVSGWTPNEALVSATGQAAESSSTVQIAKEDVGTMLLITPNINADKTVTLRLIQENSEVSPAKVEIPVNGGNGATKAIEYVESRSLAGTFVAKDGMTIMAGGLVRETDGETYWRTPVLGSIPLLGWLFRGTEKVKQRTELIVLIKPHVILTPMEGGKMSSELMKALSAHPAADGRASMGVHKPDQSPADSTR